MLIFSPNHLLMPLHYIRDPVLIVHVIVSLRRSRNELRIQTYYIESAATDRSTNAFKQLSLVDCDYDANLEA